MRKFQDSVRKFMELAKQPLLAKPGIPAFETRNLGMRLVAEEAFFELAEALGIRMRTNGQEIGLKDIDYLVYGVDGEHPPNLVEIADAIADGIYVLLWVANACGIDVEPILAEVCKNNLDKFGPGHSIGPNGKLVKPPGFKGPDIAGLIEHQINPTKIVCEAKHKSGKLHCFSCRPEFPLVWLWANTSDLEALGESQFYVGDWFTQEHRDVLRAWVTENPSVYANEFEWWYGRKP